MTPPKGYTYHTHLFEDLAEINWRLWLRANLVALVPMGAASLLIWLPYEFYIVQGTPLAVLPNETWPPILSLVATVAMVYLSIVLHELLHGLALKAMGFEPRFLFEGGYPAASIAPGSFIGRGHYLFMSLLPLVAMTAGGWFVLPFLPGVLGRPLVWALLLNAAASIGDLMVAQRVRRWPPEALFGEQQGIRVFLPLAPSRIDHESRI